MSSKSILNVEWIFRRRDILRSCSCFGNPASRRIPPTIFDKKTLVSKEEWWARGNSARIWSRYFSTYLWTLSRTRASIFSTSSFLFLLLELEEVEDEEEACEAVFWFIIITKMMRKGICHKARTKIRDTKTQIRKRNSHSRTIILITEMSSSNFKKIAIAPFTNSSFSPHRGYGNRTQLDLFPMKNINHKSLYLSHGHLIRDFS